LKSQGKIGEDQDIVMKAFILNGPHTDSEIAHILKYSDPNKVRPRRFELVELGLIKEICKRKCEITHSQNKSD